MAKKFKRPELNILPSSDERVEKIINFIMLNGKKSVARKILHNTFNEIRANGHQNPRGVLDMAIENASPSVMVKSRRFGGSVYQIPVEVKPQKRFFYAFKWILTASRGGKGKPMYKKLAEEILAAYSGQGRAVKRKEDTHRIAEANKAFAHMAKYVK